MGSRIQLHDILVEALGSRNVYYQPPESLKLQYPCIVYSRLKSDINYADNHAYRNTKKYLATVIDKNPDSVIPDKLEEKTYFTLDRTAFGDNLNHWYFTVYF